MKKIQEFIKKYWLIIVNYIVLLTIYSINTNIYVELLSGLWLFASASIGLYKLFKK